MGPSFFPQLLETFEHDALEHLAGAAIEPSQPSDTETALAREAHALKGASLTIGAQGMASYLPAVGEPRRWPKNAESAAGLLARLEHEFDRVKIRN